MDKHLHNIDQLFKDGIEGYTDPPSDNVWSNIDQQLDKREVSLTRYKYKIAKYAVAAMALLTVSFAMVLLVKTKKAQAPAVPTDSAVVSPGNKSSLITKEDQPKQADQKNSTTGTVTPEEKPVEQNTAAAPVTTGAPKTTLPEQKQQLKKPSLKENNVAVSTTTNNAQQKTITTSADKKEKKIADNIIKENKENNIAVKQTITPQIKQPAIKENKEPVLQSTDYNYTIAKTDAATTLTGSNSFTSQIAWLDEEHMSNPYAGKTAVPVIKAKRFKPVFSIAAFYNPEHVTNEVAEGKVVHREDRREEIVEGEKVKQSFNYGIQFNYQFSNHWAAVTGVGISKTKSTILPRNLYARPVPPAPGQNPPPGGDVKYKINCTAGYAFLPSKSGSAPISGDSIKALQSVNTLTYVTLPLGMKYIYKINHFAINAIAAVDMNILTNGNVQATVTETSGLKTQTNVTVQGLKPVNFSAMIGAGAEYFASNRLSVYILPETNFSLTTINKNTPTQTRRASWGMQAGVRINF